jgi:hypothetical protein
MLHHLHHLHQPLLLLPLGVLLVVAGVAAQQQAP